MTNFYHSSNKEDLDSLIEHLSYEPTYHFKEFCETHQYDLYKTTVGFKKENRQLLNLLERKLKEHIKYGQGSPKNNL